MSPPDSDTTWDPAGHWAPYTPDAAVPWDLRRVAHLHRRAGFAATWAEMRRDLADGPARSTDRLLAGTAREGVPADFNHMAAALADRADAARDAGPLRAWWVYRMLWGPDPLGERLVLLWHDHFATGNDKVRDAAAMRRQNDGFRAHARGRFAELLAAAVRDPALLLYLDAQANRRGRPNENLARELMELFTLGVGNYTEADVKEAARCLTGWTVDRGRFWVDPTGHDAGEKTVLGRTGRWGGDDLVGMLAAHPAAARRLAGRLCGWLMGEGAAGPAATAALATGLRAQDLDVGWGVATVLRSRPFFAPANLGTRVVGPVEFVVGAARAFELSDPPVSSLLVAEWAARLGQDLFHPPNVGGWPGGRAWLTTQGIVGRANYAAALVRGGLSARGVPLDALALARRHGRGRGLEDLLLFAAELLTGAAPSPGWLKRLTDALAPRGGQRDADTARAGFALALASPEIQLA